MKQRVISHLSFIMMLLCTALSTPLYASQAGLLLTDELQLKLGDAFVADGDYYRAVTEYKKLLILFADSPKAESALLGIGMAYYQGEEYESAARAFASFRNRYPASALVAQAAYHQGLSLVKLGQSEKAAEAFEVAAAAAPQQSTAVRSATFAKVVADFDRDDLAAGRTTLEQFVRKHPADAGAPLAKEAITLLDQHRDPPYKSPLLAGTMSALLPGSGHAYAGHYGDAITSLLLNGLFIAGTVVAIQQENYAVAGVAGLIGLPFYIGNIYGGANAATRWNLGLRKELRGKLAVILEYPF